MSLISQLRTTARHFMILWKLKGTLIKSMKENNKIETGKIEMSPVPVKAASGYVGLHVEITKDSVVKTFLILLPSATNSILLYDYTGTGDKICRFDGEGFVYNCSHFMLNIHGDTA